VDFTLHLLALSAQPRKLVLIMFLVPESESSPG